MTKYTAQDVAAFMLKRLNEAKTLDQEMIVFEVQGQYGDIPTKMEILQLAKRR